MQMMHFRTCTWFMPLDNTSLGQMMMEACVIQSPSSKQVRACLHKQLVSDECAFAEMMLRQAHNVLMQPKHSDQKSAMVLIRA